MDGKIKDIEKQEEGGDDEDWSGCCSHTNKNFLKYITQVSFGATVIAFCIGMIVMESNKEDDNKNLEIYFSLLSGTLGMFLPAPHLND